MTSSNCRKIKYENIRTLPETVVGGRVSVITGVVGASVRGCVVGYPVRMVCEVEVLVGGVA